MKRYFVGLVGLCLIFFLLTSVHAQSPDAELKLHHSWGGEGNVINVGTDLSLTDDGHILVVNRHFNRITRIVQGEENFQNFGGFGFGEGELVNANGITIGSDGKIYVGAYGRIQVFSSEGEYIRSIWSYYNETSYWKDDVVDLTLDADGNIHIIAGYGDTFAIKSYTQEGTLIREWSTPIGSATPLTRPVSIQITPDNKLIISDFGSNYGFGWIVVCDTEGNFIKKISEIDGGEQFEKPSDIGIDPNSGNIFVLDSQKYRVYEFTANFDELIGSWGEFGEEPENLNGIGSIEVNSQGNVFIVSSDRPVKVFTQKGEYIRSYGIRSDSPGQFWTPFDILVSKSGVVYAADSNNYRIQAFDVNGNYLFEWNMGPSGQFGFPVALSEDQAGNIYAAHQATDQICKYTVGETLPQCWGKSGEGQGEFASIIDVTVNAVDLPSGTEEWVFTVDNLHRMQIFSTDGDFIKGYSLDDYVSRLLVDRSGILYVLNLSGNELYKFNFIEWEFLQKYNLFEILGGNFASALEFGPDGAIYFTNQQINYIYRVDPITMTLDKTWYGDYGDVNTYFHSARGFSFSEDGLLYLIDLGNARVLVFELLEGVENQSINSISVKEVYIQTDENLVQNGSFENELNTALWTFTGALPSQRTTIALSGDYALQLGELTHPGEDYAQAFTTISIPENFLFPELSFNYKVESNDPIELADFYVEIQDGAGLNHLSKVIQFGAGTNTFQSEWRQITVDLSEYVGQTIRLNFIARNRTNSSSGIVAIIDEVEVISIEKSVFLPMILK